MITYHCPACQSEDIAIDAAARWNHTTHAWELSSTHDVITCQDCGLEGHPESFQFTRPVTDH